MLHTAQEGVFPTYNILIIAEQVVGNTSLDKHSSVHHHFKYFEGDVGISYSLETVPLKPPSITLLSLWVW